MGPFSLGPPNSAKGVANVAYVHVPTQKILHSKREILVVCTPTYSAFLSNVGPSRGLMQWEKHERSFPDACEHRKVKPALSQRTLTHSRAGLHQRTSTRIHAGGFNAPWPRLLHTVHTEFRCLLWACPDSVELLRPCIDVLLSALVVPTRCSHRIYKKNKKTTTTHV